LQPFLNFKNFMRNYEVTFIVDPVLSGDEVRSTAQTYKDMLTQEGAKIVHSDEMGLRQLAYPINKRSTGVYYSVEFAAENPVFISKLELALKRDERIMRFLTIALDKYAVKYNEDKRSGKIGKRVSKDKPYEAVRQEMVAQTTRQASTIILEEEE
jgi:small subunit ribosomal protein S6